MPPAPPASGPPGKGLKVSRTTLIIIGVVAAAGIGYLLWKRHQAAAAGTTAAASPGTGCPPGTTDDGNGNCIQDSADSSGQIGTLQTEIGDLQSSDATAAASAPVKVPNVVGMTVTAAAADLYAQGLRPHGPSGDQGRKVSGQNPTAGTEVARGSTVSLGTAPAPKPKPKAKVPAKK